METRTRIRRAKSDITAIVAGDMVASAKLFLFVFAIGVPSSSVSSDLREYIYIYTQFLKIGFFLGENEPKTLIFFLKKN